MANTFFQFKQFTIHQDKCAMKVTTDTCLFGAWVASVINDKKLRITNCLDIGTGTGLLTLMLAQKIQTEIHAIEIDKEATLQAIQNISASPWAERIKVFNGDAKGFIFQQKYDAIISNPPFYDNQLKGDDPKKNIAHHNEGLQLNELLCIIKNNLQEEGSFFLMLPYAENKNLNKLLKSNQLGIVHTVNVRQSHNHLTFRIFIHGKLSRKINTRAVDEEISICDQNRNYTPEFISLLKDYYLHL